MRQFEIQHLYGPNVHILNDPLSLTLLSSLCAKETKQPHINRLASTLYRQLVSNVIAAEIPTTRVEVPTRMIDHTPKGVWKGEIINPAVKVAVVCVARAGIFPSQVCYDFLNEILEPDGVRQDHMLMSRTADKSGHVNGAAIQGAKIGDSVEGVTMLIPDPMGATGTTIKTVRNYYRNRVGGKPARVIALNLIITSEYIQRLHTEWPDTIIYAYRLDRGLSEEWVLATIPGTHPEQEHGLTENGYIVPGGGGFGEVMNNVYV